MSNTDATNYGRLTALLVAAWLAFSFTASKLLIFHAGSPNAVVPPLPLGLAVVVPIFFFAYGSRRPAAFANLLCR